MTYTFPSYIPAAAVAVTLIATAAGVFVIMKRRWHKAAIFFFLIAVVAGGLLAPMLALDRVVLDEEKLEQTTGLWFSPTVKGFKLADVAWIKISTARDRKNREYEVWIVHNKNGVTKTIDPGDLWEMNAADIIRRLRDKGIFVR